MVGPKEADPEDALRKHAFEGRLTVEFIPRVLGGSIDNALSQMEGALQGDPEEQDGRKKVNVPGPNNEANRRRRLNKKVRTADEKGATIIQHQHDVTVDASNAYTDSYTDAKTDVTSTNTTTATNNTAVFSGSKVDSNTVALTKSDVVATANCFSWAGHTHTSVTKSDHYQPTFHYHEGSKLPVPVEPIIEPFNDVVPAHLFKKLDRDRGCIGYLSDWLDSCVNFVPILFGCKKVQTHVVVEDMLQTPGWITKSDFAQLTPIEVSPQLIDKCLRHKRGRNSSSSNASSLLTLAHEFPEVKRMDPKIVDNTTRLMVQYHDWKRHQDALHNPEFVEVRESHPMSPNFYLASLLMVTISTLLMCTFIKIALLIKILMIMGYIALSAYQMHLLRN
jgi:hypothetical protein